MTTQDDNRPGKGSESAPESERDCHGRELIARRKLLKMAYVAPAIIGTLLISQKAEAQAASCHPYSNPCNPPPPCNPRPPKTMRSR
jgi:hypothetical protein